MGNCSGAAEEATAPDFNDRAEARVRFADLLAATERDERSRDLLLSALPSRAEVVFEGRGWSVAVPGLPVAADGAALDEALSEAIVALREYADDWQERLFGAPNHRVHRDCALLVRLSDDEQLRDWLLGKGRESADRAG